VAGPDPALAAHGGSARIHLLLWIQASAAVYDLEHGTLARGDAWGDFRELTAATR
jgi:hypothetical protein